MIPHRQTLGKVYTMTRCVVTNTDGLAFADAGCTGNLTGKDVVLPEDVGGNDAVDLQISGDGGQQFIK